MAKKSIINLESFEANAQAAYASQIIASSSDGKEQTKSEVPESSSVQVHEPQAQESGESVAAQVFQPQAIEQGSEPLRTKKATTIMPKEVFGALQRYCTDNDTPKHRALYLFILNGLRDAATITDEEYQRFRDMAPQLTTTYEKK